MSNENLITIRVVVGHSVTDVRSMLFCESSASREMFWSVDNEEIASINERFGYIRGKNVGTTTIHAYDKEGGTLLASAIVSVEAPIYIENIVFPDETRTVCIDNKSVFLKTMLYPVDIDHKGLVWTSSDESVATVYYGSLTLKSLGTTTITATAEKYNGETAPSATCTINVVQTLTEALEMNPSNSSSKNVGANPIDIYTGGHLLKNTLFQLFGGQALSVVAQYDSIRLVDGSLGKGWYHNYEKCLKEVDSKILVYTNPSTFLQFTASSGCSVYNCTTEGKSGYTLTVDCSATYPYSLNCNWDHFEYYNADGKLVKIVDHSGFATLISHTNSLITITDTVTNKKIYMEKDSDGKITRIYDNNSRETVLTYNGEFLKTIKDANNNSITYTYDSYGRVLTCIKNNKNDIKYFRNTYDAYGRILTQKDGVGSNPTLFDYMDCGVRKTTNRNGDASYRTYNNKGLLVNYKDENGNETSYEYDANFNITKETDALGKSINKVYNSFNKPTEVTDKNGNKTTFTYDAKGNVTNITYPEINGVVPTESFTYNSRNQMLTHTDIRGTVTTYTYGNDGLLLSKKVGSKNAIFYTYENGLLKTVTDAMNHVTTYGYNDLGQVSSKTDANNKVTSYEYDKTGNLTKTTYPNEKTVSTVYDENYQKIEVTDANGNTTKYAYNGNMKLILVTLPDNNKIEYEYDGEDRLKKTIDQARNVSSIDYDKGGRVTYTYAPDGATVHYEYDKVGNVTKETNPKDATVTKTYDNNGNLLTVTDVENNTTEYAYNAMNMLTHVTNPWAGLTVYVYSPAGDLLSETDAIGHTKAYTYDDYGNRLTATDAREKTTTYTYDDNNNLLTVKDALDRVTTYTYDALDRCDSVKNALNKVTNYGYDALGRRTTITDARRNTFTTVYDGNGNVTKTIDAKGNTISETVYNNLNLPYTVTDAMGKTRKYLYNALGKVDTFTNELNYVSEYGYDPCGRNTSVLDFANKTSTAAYDWFGNVTRITGPLGGNTAYSYDNRGRLKTESTVSGGTKIYEYNALNVRWKITNARGQIRQIFYDSKGRITGHSSPEGTVSYTYDENDNVLTVTDRHGTVARTYDDLNRVKTYTDTYGKVIEYDYDEVGNLSKITYPDQTTVTYGYDENRNLTRVTDWANRTTHYSYDVNNRVTGVIKPDGSVTTTVYDNKQRVMSTVEKTADCEVISGFEYTYDNLSRITEEKVLANSTKMCYTYDSLSRVKTRTIKDATTNVVISTETFTYDAAGNVTDAPDSCFGYDTQNRLIIFNNNEVSYDLDGNMLSNGSSLSCSYDSSNKLITAGGHTYTYNGESVRIRNLCTDEDTTYTYDNNAKLNRLLCKTTNGVTTKYVYGRGLIGEEVGGAFKTYHFDARGSTIAITDASGNITDTFAYDTYGKLISRTGTSNVIFGYNGRDGVVTDKNGLIYMRARYYSPAMKRFINADIIAGSIDNAVTLNRFAYANGNPVSMVDPFGLSSINAKYALDEQRTNPNFVMPKAEPEKKTPERTDTPESKLLREDKIARESIHGTFDKEAFEEYYEETIEKSDSNFGERFKDGFQTFINAITDNVGAKVSLGKEKSADPKYLFFATVENGIGYSKDFGGDKPVNFFASAGENWWEFWKWSVGIDVNVNGYGGGFSIGGENSINVHLGHVSHEVGSNALGRISHKVVHHIGDGYVYSKYSLNGPEIALAAVGAYYAPTLVPALAPAISSALSSLGNTASAGAF